MKKNFYCWFDVVGNSIIKVLYMIGVFYICLDFNSLTCN